MVSATFLRRLGASNSKRERMTEPVYPAEDVHRRLQYMRTLAKFGSLDGQRRQRSYELTEWVWPQVLRPASLPAAQHPGLPKTVTRAPMPTKIQISKIVPSAADPAVVSSMDGGGSW